MFICKCAVAKLAPYLCIKGALLKVYMLAVYHVLCLLQTTVCCHVHSLFIDSAIELQKQNMF
jgi:hypothetical protein